MKTTTKNIETLLAEITSDKAIYHVVHTEAAEKGHRVVLSTTCITKMCLFIDELVYHGCSAHIESVDHAAITTTFVVFPA